MVFLHHIYSAELKNPIPGGIIIGKDWKNDKFRPLPEKHPKLNFSPQKHQFGLICLETLYNW